MILWALNLGFAASGVTVVGADKLPIFTRIAVGPRFDLSGRYGLSIDLAPSIESPIDLVCEVATLIP